MVKSLNHYSIEVERIFEPLLDAIAAANPELSLPYLEVEDQGDDVFTVSIVVKYLIPERRIDYEQA
jgi:hypothetical protein